MSGRSLTVAGYNAETLFLQKKKETKFSSFTYVVGPFSVLTNSLLIGIEKSPRKKCMYVFSDF